MGPDDTDCWTTGELVSLFCEKWNQAAGAAMEWENRFDGGPHEANFLKLDCSKIKRAFGWRPKWDVETAMEKIVEWTREYQEGGDWLGCMERQIREFL